MMYHVSSYIRRLLREGNLPYMMRLRRIFEGLGLKPLGVGDGAFPLPGRTVIEMDLERNLAPVE